MAQITHENGHPFYGVEGYSDTYAPGAANWWDYESDDD
jgi:nucleoside phosphorylase